MDQKWGKPKISSTVEQGSMRAVIMVLKHPIGGPEEEMLPGEAPGLVALSLQGDRTRSKDLRNSHTSLKRNCCKPKSASCRIMETA